MPRTNTSAFPARKRLIVAAISACFASAPAWPNPTAPQVVNGSASFSQKGNLLSVTNSSGAIINWNSFSIGANETTRFNQASAASSVLNRVIANDPSVLLGTLSSNGKVWLVNPAGIMVGQGARIDVGGFVASTLNVRAEDFLAGRLSFQSTPGAGKIENRGQITTPSGGSVYLVAPAVENHGIINAPGGEVILAAGQKVDLLDTGTPGVKVEVVGSEGSATNLGEIIAEAGRIGMAGVLVKNSGTLNASSVVKDGGRVFLKASADAYVDGDARIVTTGKKGGSIEVLGERVAVKDQAQLDASGNTGGGTVLVGGDYQGKNAAIQNSQITYLGPNAAVKADAVDKGDGGKVIVWADNTTRAYGNISARGGQEGGNGGFIETSGKQYLDVAAIKVSTAAPNGTAGNWLLDPTDIAIVHSGTSGSATFTSNIFDNGSGATATLNDYDINANIASSDITVSTISGGGGTGDITFDASGGAITITNGSGSARTLTLTADHDVKFYGGSTAFETTVSGLLGIKFNPGAGRKVDVQSGATAIFNGLNGSGFVAAYIGGTSGGTWENSGTVTLSGVSYIDLNSDVASTFNNTASGTLNLGSTQGWAIQSTSGAQAERINNAGTVNVTAGTSFEAAYSQTSTGTLNIANGQFLNLQNADTLSGTINIGTGSSLNLPEVHTGARTFSGAAINDAGTLSFNALPVTFANTKLSYTGGTGDFTIPTGITYIGNVGYSASRNLTVSSSITTTGNVVLRADSGGTGTGTIIFTGVGSVALSGGLADFYYNPTVFGTPDNFSAKVTYGTLTEWMLVNDVAHLQSMNTNLAGSYALGNSVDASATSGWNNGAGFAPIGDYTTKFTGTLDGLGHTINGLTINRPTTDYVGLIGAVGTGGAVRNIGMVGGSVTGRNQVGGLAGTNWSTIENAYATGSVTGVDSVGGLIGESWYGGIGNSHATGSVTGTNYVGGLAGYNSGVIAEAYATGGVTGTNYVGGLVGLTYGNVSNSYSSGSVTGVSDVGGLVGYNGGTLSNSHYDNDNVTINSNHYVTEGGLYTTQYQDWLTHGKALDIANYSASLPLSGDGYYTIGSTQGLKDLLGFVDNAGYKFRLTGNLDLASLPDWHIPVFTGMEFDGAGYTMANLSVNQPFNSNIGLIGRLNGSSIVTGLGLTNVSVTGKSHVGALVGDNDSGTISTSYASGNVVGESSVGGLVGYNGWSGFITDSHATASVTGSGYSVGGLVGTNDGSISTSYATGTVSGISDVGGLAGSNWGDIADAYATGNVTGTDNVGGFVGSNGGEGGAYISNTYATGSVTGSGSYVGGLVGYNSWSSIDNSYATGPVTGGDYVGGLVGYNDGAVGTSHATGSVTANSDYASAGGLVGFNDGSLTDSYATGSVDAPGYGANAGGLVGSNSYYGTLVASYTAGAVTASGDYASAGGLAGYNNGSVTDSYATGSVSATGAYAYAGGLVGQNFGTIDNSYSAGVVSGSNAGGLVGWEEGSITSSYWDTDTSGITILGGGIGKTTDEMKQLATFSGWSIANASTDGLCDCIPPTWRIYEGSTYPLLKSFLAPLTVTATSGSKVYDGTADGIGVSYSLAPDMGKVLGTTSYTGATKDVGFHTITPGGLYSSQQGYDIGYASGDLTINPYAVSLSGSRVYDGTANVAAGVLSIGALIGSETLTLSGSGTVPDKYVGTDKAITLGSLALGDGGNGGLASNYTLSGGTHLASITARPLSVTATGVSKIYDGLTSANVNYGDNRVSGDVLTIGGSAAYLDKNVGIAKTVNVSGINLSGTDAGNYTVITTAATTADITARALTVSATGQNKVYDGLTNASVNYGDNRVSGDVLTIGGSAAYLDKNVGIAKTVNVSGINLSGTDAGNYTVNTTAATTADITARALNVSATGQNKVYDGLTSASVSYGDNRVSGDVLTIGGSASYLDKNVGVAKTVNVSGINVTGTDAGNYTFNTTAATTADITARALTVSATGQNKVYDGLTSASVTYGDNRVSGDVLTIGGSAFYLDKNVSVAKTVNVSGINLSGADAGNYTNNTTAATTADITIRPLSTWIGGATGNWSVAANWDALPDLSNVLAVSVPTGKTVTYDAGAGSTNLASLTAAGLSIAGGSLNIANGLTVSSSFSQTGGTLAFGGDASANITQASGNLNLPAFAVANLSVNAPAGAITQSGPIAALTLNTQSQGATTLTNPDNQVSNRVDMTAGGPLNLWASGDLILGAINAGANPVEIKAGGAILKAVGTETSTNIIASAANLASIFGGAKGDLAVSTDTQITGALTATVGAGADFGGIRIKNTGAQPASVTLIDNALAGASVSFLNTGNITSTSGFTLKTLMGGDLALLSNGNITWDGGSLSTPSGSALMSADGSIAVTGALSSGVDLALSSKIAINVNGSVSTSGTGTAGIVAPSVAINGSFNAADDVGIIADTINLGTGSRTGAGHDAIFAAGNVMATNATVSAGHDISAAITGDLRLNGSSFTAGNDIFITMMGATSTLYLNDVAGLPTSILWAQAPSTIHLDFPARASDGMVVDGVAVDPLKFATASGDCGMYYGATMTPATPGAGLHVAYGITMPETTTTTVVPTVADTVMAAITASTTSATRPTDPLASATFDVNPPLLSGLGGTPGADQIGGTEGTFGGSSDTKKDDKDDKNKTDRETGLKKQADKPATKRIPACS